VLTVLSPSRNVALSRWTRSTVALELQNAMVWVTFVGTVSVRLSFGNWRRLGGGRARRRRPSSQNVYGELTLFNAEEWHNTAIALLFAILALALIHFLPPLRRRYPIMLALNCLGCLINLVLVVCNQTGVIPYQASFVAYAAFCMFLFIFLSEVLKSGLAKLLSGWFGDKWTNQIRFVPTLIGIYIGCMVGQPLNNIAVLMGLTGLVIDVVKIRAENAGWNRIS
jgi:hypothetical protein